MPKFKNTNKIQLSGNFSRLLRKTLKPITKRYVPMSYLKTKGVTDLL